MNIVSDKKNKAEYSIPLGVVQIQEAYCVKPGLVVHVVGMFKVFLSLEAEYSRSCLEYTSRQETKWCNSTICPDGAYNFLVWTLSCNRTI